MGTSLVVDDLVRARATSGEVSTCSASERAPVTADQATPARDRQDFVRQYCEDRYRKLWVEDTQRVLSGELVENTYWRKYWYQQHVQFVYWLHGRLPREAYRRWLEFRRREYKINLRLLEVDYRSAWRECALWLSDAAFSGFMERVFVNDIDTALDETRTPLS